MATQTRKKRPKAHIHKTAIKSNQHIARHIVPEISLPLKYSINKCMDGIMAVVFVWCFQNESFDWDMKMQALIVYCSIDWFW